MRKTFWLMDERLADKENLIAMIDKGCSQNTIAFVTGWSVDTVREALKYHGIDLSAAKITARRHRSRL